MDRVLYFDAFNGVSGDMVLGALIHLGLPLEHLESELARLPLDPYRLTVEPVERQGLQGVNFRVRTPEPHVPQTPHGAAHHHGRTLKEIRTLIAGSALDAWVKATAVSIFERLGEAEATVHGASIEAVHFHEVGATDALVDIVGACVGFRYFGVEQFYSSALNLGSGTVTFSHGTWPVPAPATAELVKGFPVFPGREQGELTTPTGAAIVTTLVDPLVEPPVVTFEAWGLGAGDREFETIPNMLRLALGRVRTLSGGETLSPLDPDWREETVALLETNLDDMEPELVGHFMELALVEGALDVFCTPVHMKKNRPGFLLSVLCRPEDQTRMAELMFRETTTLGIRRGNWRRWTLGRESLEVETEYGKVRVKVAKWRDRVVNVAPEYEDLKALCRRHRIPMKELRLKVLEKLSEQER